MNEPKDTDDMQALKNRCNKIFRLVCRDSRDKGLRIMEEAIVEVRRCNQECRKKPKTLYKSGDKIAANILTKVYGNPKEMKILEPYDRNTYFEKSADNELRQYYEHLKWLIREEKSIFESNFEEPEERIFATLADYKIGTEHISDEANVKAFKYYYCKQKRVDIWKSYFNTRRICNRLKFGKQVKVEENANNDNREKKETIYVQKKEKRQCNFLVNVISQNERSLQKERFKSLMVYTLIGRVRKEK
jgi:hypothetical protein